MKSDTLAARLWGHVVVAAHPCELSLGSQGSRACVETVVEVLRDTKQVPTAVSNRLLPSTVHEVPSRVVAGRVEVVLDPVQCSRLVPLFEPYLFSAARPEANPASRTLRR